MIMKRKRYVFINVTFTQYWQIVFIKLWAILTNRDAFWSLWDLNYEKLKRDSSNLLDIRIKLILTFKVYQLNSLEYFGLPNRNVFLTAASTWFKILLSILVVMLKRVFLPVRKLGQWRRNWHVISVSQPQEQSGFNVSLSFCFDYPLVYQRHIKNHSHKKNHSLEIWAVKLRFLLI